MANQPEHEYRLELDPKILQLLGPHLYTNIYYILAELIANAYDADAKNVYIFGESDAITVEDDGTGMTYEDTKKYLRVADETRTNKKESYTDKGRRKIGRKGIGKLAALSVSENVWIQTIKQNEKSGFILSRNIGSDRLLKPLKDAEMSFKRIKEKGTAVIMRAPQYKLNKNFGTIKKNLLKIFPLVDKNFRIHIVQDGKEETIGSFDQEIIKELGGLIILGENFKHLAKNFKTPFPKKKKRLLRILPDKSIKLKLENRFKKKKTYNLVISGWIGAYKTTRGRRLGPDYNDFPDNFISLLSNDKLGEYNVLPAVGKNKLYEVYVVGQIHVDLFEETELPDMALSNRQGYKSDDERYRRVIDFLSKKLLPEIVDIRADYSAFENEHKKSEKLDKQAEQERTLREKIDRYKRDASDSAAKKIITAMRNKDSNPAGLSRIIEDEMNAFSGIVGIKNRVDEQKKKILISHTQKDKDIADIIYQMLLFNGVPAEDILYTNCDDEVCRIPESEPVYDYLMKFFVDSYSTEKIYVIYVTSSDMEKSWGAIIEVGAGWITRKAHKVFNIRGCTPQKPLNIDLQWHNSTRNADGILMSKPECDKFASRIESISDDMGYKPRSRSENVQKIKILAEVP